MTIRNCGLTLCCCVGLSLAYSSNAQSTPEIIHISGSRSPIELSSVVGDITIIDSAQIQASGAISIAELLRTVPGMNISSSGPLGSLTEIRFRGSESNHVLVTIDGIEINDLAQGGLSDFGHLLSANIERIEILKGPQSALWGSAAISGIINIVTKGAGSEALQGSASLKAGSDQTYQASAHIAKQMTHFDFSLSANALNSDGQNISVQGSENDAYQNQQLSAKVHYRIKPSHHVTLIGHIVDYENEFDGIDFISGLPQDADFYTQGDKVAVSGAWYFTPDDNFYSQSLIYQLTKATNLNIGFAGSEAYSSGTKQRLLWNNQLTLSPHKQLTLSYERVEEDFEQRGQASIFGDPNQEQRFSANAFIADTRFRFDAIADLLFQANYRYDSNSDFDSQDSFRIAAKYPINDSFTVFISRGKAIKNPSFTERFGFFANVFVGNDKLLPEASYSTEIGLSAELKEISANVTWFDSRLQNEILGFVFNPDDFSFTANNAELSSHQRGLEIEIFGEIADIRWQVHYAYLDAKEEDAQELRRAKHSGGFTINAPLTQNQSIYIQASYTGTRLDRFFPSAPPSPRTEALDAHWLVNLNYRYVYSDALNFSLKIDNLLNEEYQNVIGFQTPSRTLLVGAEYEF